MKKGFTLIEIMAVVLILAILTSIAMPQYRKSIERSRAAEAMQMLPAIYDARDRAMVETNCTWPVNALPTCSTNGTVTFPKLDIAMKGSGSGTTWTTDSFEYKLFVSSSGPFRNYRRVSGKLRRGSYKDTYIYYDGNKFTCCASSSASEACDRLNIDRDSACLVQIVVRPGGLTPLPGVSN